MTRDELIWRTIFLFGIVLGLVNFVADAHREHKVHNIVLYPDKHSWCKTLQIKQVISYPGCKSEEIDNNVCVGACFSYSIPHTEPSDPGEVIVPYCDSCQPSDTTWHHVTLECEKNHPDTPAQLLKRVQIINNCSCSSCEKNRFNNPGDLDDDIDDLLIPHNDVPDLLNFLNNRNETNSIIDSEHTKNMRIMMNHKIVTLLKNIQEKNSQHDKEQLMDLLRIIQGPNQKLNDKSIADFVESLNSENIELDIPRLREILIQFEHSKYYEKSIKKYNIDNIASNEHGSSDESIIDGIEGSHHDMGHLKGAHIGMGLHSSDQSLQQSSIESESIEHNIDDGGSSSISSSSIISSSTSSVHQSPSTTSTGGGAISIGQIHHISGQNDSGGSHHSSSSSSSSSSTSGKHHHHHHIGENIVNHGHLTRGPHGALVIEPDRIHEKLDVNPHELKPNHAGTLLSYSSHSSRSAENNKSLD